MAPKIPDIHFIDFEGSTRTGVVEFGITTLRMGRLETTHTRLCGARATLFSREIEVHGITNNAVEGCEPMENSWELFRSLRENGLFAAHNHVVENTLINQVWPHGGIFPSFGDEVDASGWGPWIDTRWLVPNLFRDVASCGLMDLVAQFDLIEPLDHHTCAFCPTDRCQPHCALYAAIASAVLFRHISHMEAFETFGINDWLAHSRPSPNTSQLEFF